MKSMVFVYDPQFAGIFIAICLWLASLVRLLYFFYKYEKYIRKEHPEKVADLTFGLSGFQIAKTMLRKVDINDPALLKLRKKMGNSAYLFLFLWILVMFVIFWE